MASVPPPQGMNEVDYEAIEAAVTETVRGRWFLSEFARRNRLAETRQLLDAMARLEAAVATGPAALPSADPSIRLLIQRIKEIAAQLGTVAGDMRTAGVEDRFVEAVDGQARAVAGMMRSATPSSTPLSRPPTKIEAPTTIAAQDPVQSWSRPAVAPQAEPRPAQRLQSPAVDTKEPPAKDDPRLAALAPFDNLSLPEKIALFT